MGTQGEPCDLKVLWFLLWGIDPRQHLPTVPSRRGGTYRQDMLKIEQTISSDFDKLILTISSGALVLSMAFFQYVAPHPSVSTLRWISWAWSLFAISVISILVALFGSQLAHRNAVSQEDHGLIDHRVPGGFLTLIARFLALVAMVTCIFAVGFFVVFAVLSVHGPRV
jgi:hypothetical protein